MSAGAALKLETACLQAPTGQVGRELLLDESGQATVVLHSLQKLWPMLGDTLVERGVFGLAASVVTLALDLVGQSVSG